MTDRPDSFSIMIGTPQGEDNAFYELYQHALTAPNWLARMHKASDRHYSFRRIGRCSAVHVAKSVFARV